MLLENLVIGSTIEAALYALVNDFYFISNRKISPLFYEKSDLAILGSKDTIQIWNKLNLTLGLLSKRISFSAPLSARISADSLKINTDSESFSCQFGKLFVFDPTGIQLHDQISLAKAPTYTVFDDFELSVLGPKRYKLESLSSSSNFCKKLHFYSSDRVHGSDYITDCVVESELTTQELASVDYSDSMVRFVVERHLASIGVQGRLMDYYKNGNPKYRKPKVVHVRRLSFEKDNNVYYDTNKIKFLDLSLEEIIEECTKR